MTVTKTISNRTEMLDIQWAHQSKLSEFQARQMLKTLFPEASNIDVFREDGRTFNHDDGQSAGSALVWKN